LEQAREALRQAGAEVAFLRGEFGPGWFENGSFGGESRLRRGWIWQVKRCYVALDG
jgi:hypothetical protein